MDKKGISLVALVITIIVLIILTGAVIATFIEGGIIDQAKKAVKESDYTTLREAYDTAYNVRKIDIATGTGGEVNKAEALKEAAKQVGLEDEFKETANSIVYIGENEYIEEWLLSIEIVSIGEEDIDLLEDLDTEGYIYRGGYITGITSNKTPLSNVIDADRYEIIKNSNNTTDGVTTGDRIVSKETDKTVATIIVYGDIDGNMTCTTNEIYNILNNTISPTQAMIAAADANHSGRVTYDDVIEFLRRWSDPGYVIEQDVEYDPNIQLISDEKINAGIKKLPDVKSFGYEMIYDSESDEYYEERVLTLTKEKTRQEIANMFKTYFDAKLQYRPQWGEQIASNLEILNITNYGYITIKYEITE